ncbi:MAG: hypothetical protein D6704_11525 [Nitrospirae bacterium]|nr:MAG: hypothetical protein D6704_11525 [Nitrospirota bacterium]
MTCRERQRELSKRKGALWRRVVLSGMGFACLLLVLGCSQRSDRVVSIAVHPVKPSILYIATEEAVYKSRDYGQTWIRLNTELSRTRVMNLLIDPMLPANVYAGTLADGVYKSPDGGRHWFPHNQGIQKGTISVNVNQLVAHPRNSEILYAATTVGVFRSTDGGKSWVERMHGMKEINFVVTLAIDPQHPNIIYAGTSGGVYRSMDATEHWEMINRGLVPEDAKMASMALGVNTLAIDPLQTDVVYAGTTQGLFKTHNKGENWSKIDRGVRDLYVSSVVIDPGNPSHLYIGTSQGVFESKDGGETWEPRNEGLGNLNVRTVVMAPQDSRILYCGTNGGGLYTSRDAAKHWVSLPLTVIP